MKWGNIFGEMDLGAFSKSHPIGSHLPVGLSGYTKTTIALILVSLKYFIGKCQRRISHCDWPSCSPHKKFKGLTPASSPKTSFANLDPKKHPQQYCFSPNDKQKNKKWRRGCFSFVKAKFFPLDSFRSNVFSVPRSTS